LDEPQLRAGGQGIHCDDFETPGEGDFSDGSAFETSESAQVRLQPKFDEMKGLALCECLRLDDLHRIRNRQAAEWAALEAVDGTEHCSGLKKKS
jgi:hypothetical protein